MATASTTSELSRTRANQQSCPAFSDIHSVQDAEVDSQAGVLSIATGHARPCEDEGVGSESMGFRSWFEDRVGAPRLVRKEKRSPEEQGRRDTALEKVHHFATRCDISLHSGMPVRTAMSSPDLQGNSLALEAMNDSPEDALKGKPSPSPPASCFQACGDLRSLTRTLMALIQDFLGNDLGVADPGFQDPENAVIIFDWDDTLLPTTYILSTVIPSLAEEDRAGVLPESSPHQAALAAHAHLVGFLLRTARRVARVAIVSNSLSPWVEASSARYLPGLDLESLLRELDVPIYYARRHLPNIAVTYKVEKWDVHLDRSSGGRIGVDIIPEFDGSLAVARIEEGGLMDKWNQEHPDQEVHPGDRFSEVNGSSQHLTAECRKMQNLRITVYRAVPDRDPYVEAKRIDMVACLEKFYGRHQKWRQNVLSIGDACTEQRAIKEVLQDSSVVSTSARRPLCKTVNLIDTPTLEQLSNELRILLVWLSHMVQYHKDFDLFMDGLDDLEAELFKKA